jgi:hypothetical protein
MTLQDNLKVEKALPAYPQPIDIAPLRRFELADFHRHTWLSARIAKAYPEMTERYVLGWLRGLIYNQEYCFQYQEHAVGLCNLVRSYGLQARPMIVEKFVFAEDPANSAHQEAAAQMYVEFAAWGKFMDCDRMLLVGQLSDVPKDMIKDRLGKALVEVKSYHVRL